MKLLTPLFLLAIGSPAPADDARGMLIVVSEPGNPDYDLEFRRQAKAWQDLAGKSGFAVHTIGLDAETPEGDRPLVEKSISNLPKDGGDLWFVWIGHGSYDGRTANFNLRGPDIDSKAVGELLKPFKRRLVILNLFSASAPFLAELSARDRIIVSSTRGPGERNFSRFGGKFADALTSPDADLDLDGSISLLEATLHAAAGTKAFYEDAQRVVQEHSTLDDNGDKRATPTDAFKGLQADGDGALARQIHFKNANPDRLAPDAREERARLEAAIDTLRKAKPNLPEKKYYQELERLMLEMAELYGFGK